MQSFNPVALKLWPWIGNKPKNSLTDSFLWFGKYIIRYWDYCAALSARYVLIRAKFCILTLIGQSPLGDNEPTTGKLQVAIIFTMTSVLVISTVFENHQKSHFGHQCLMFCNSNWMGKERLCDLDQKRLRGCLYKQKPCLKITTMDK